jgi:hypothetical protein
MYRQTDRHSGWISAIVAATRSHMQCTGIRTWCACVLISLLFFRWKHSRINASLMCKHVSVFVCPLSWACTYTRAHTHAEITHTLIKLRWWRVWRWFTLAQTYVLFVCIYTFFWLFAFLSIYTAAGCFFWLFREYFTLQASGHTDLHARTDRHSGWIIEIVAAHPLVPVVHSRTPLRSGWATELQWTQACTRVCACVLISFLSFGENIVVFMLH